MIPSIMEQDSNKTGDHNFQQGSEIFIDLYFNESSGKASLVSRPAEGPDITLFAEEEFHAIHAEVSNSLIVVSWKVNDEINYASFVYPGTWVMALEITNQTNLKDKNLVGKMSEKLLCEEASGFWLLL